MACAILAGALSNCVGDGTGPRELRFGHVGEGSVWALDNRTGCWFSGSEDFLY